MNMLHLHLLKFLEEDTEVWKQQVSPNQLQKHLWGMQP